MMNRKPRPEDQDPRFRYDNTGMQVGLNWPAPKEEDDDES